MPGNTRSGGGRKSRGMWEAVGGITAVASLIAAIVFGIAELIKKPEGQPSVLPADERLELIDVEFAAEPVDVAVLEMVRKGDRPKISAKPGKGGVDTQAHRPLVVTLRNPADDPAVLTGVKLVVREVLFVPSCGTATGGAVSASVNFDFRFPAPLDGEWSKVNPQNFMVAPHGVDALSITMGPELSDEMSHAWRFSVFGVSKGGREAHWGDGIATNFGIGTPEAYRAYVWWDAPKRNLTEQDVRTCAAQRLQRLEELAKPGDDLIVHPGFTGLTEAFREAAEG